MNFSSHPEPLFEREHWQSLDGSWQFAFGDAQPWRRPQDVQWDRHIQVPYPPESLASGIHDPSFHQILWYRKTLTPQVSGERLYLHFGAVDYQASVWVNNQLVAEHQGGHTPFSAEISTVVPAGEAFEIVVRAIDDPHDLAKPRGKQDWELSPHEIWYPRTSGIWQTVWLEACSEIHLDTLHWSANVERWEIAFQARLQGHLTGDLTGDLRLRVRLEAGGVQLADDSYAVTQANLSRTICLQDGGIDIKRHQLLWTPEHPQLIEATAELLQDGKVIDRVRSYTAMRSVKVDQHHFILNGRPYLLKMVLDQGYWPDSLMSATDEQLRRDVELTRLLGFNGARKHQKIESPRYLYWADVLGLLVWEELPSAYIFTNESARRLIQEWTEAIERDRSHPCIVAWVPINESWGVPDLPLVAAQRDFVRGLYHLTKALDPSRPVIGNDGWEIVVSDISAIHDYTDKPEKLLLRYSTLEALQASLDTVRPHHRQLNLDTAPAVQRPAMLTEFGGIAYATSADLGWGYNRKTDPQGLQEEYAALLAAVHACEGLAGFCYTQLADTFQEKNGLLFEDRTPKTDLTALALATRGSRTAQDQERDADLGAMGYDRFWRLKSQPSPVLPQMAEASSAD